MIMLILAFVILVAIIVALTYPSNDNANRITLFIRNVCLLGILYINFSLAYAILHPVLLSYFSGMMDAINGFFNSLFIEPISKVFGVSLDSIVEIITFLPNYVGEYFYRELSVNEGSIYSQIFAISVAITGLLVLDIITKLLFVDKNSSDINHKILCITHYGLTIITGIAVLLSVCVILPYYFDLGEIIIIEPGIDFF